MRRRTLALFVAQLCLSGVGGSGARLLHQSHTLLRSARKASPELAFASAAASEAGALHMHIIARQPKCVDAPCKETCRAYNRFEVSLPSGDYVTFDDVPRGDPGLSLQKDCGDNYHGRCSIRCENRAWMPQDDCRNCREKGMCMRYSPFSYTYDGVTIDFDLSKGYAPGEKVTQKCPSGKEGMCTAKCSDPGGDFGGWTFPSCECGKEDSSTNATPAKDNECSRFDPLTYTIEGVNVDFDLSKGHTVGESVTQKCPSGGKEGTCTALCSEPGGTNGGWTFPSCDCGSTDTCPRYNPFSYTHNNVQIDFDLSKGYKVGESVEQPCPGGEGTCEALCVQEEDELKWTFPKCTCGQRAAVRLQ